MVQNPGKALCISAIKPVNLPESIKVEEHSSGLPMAVWIPDKMRITTIGDCWRIDDEWWRDDPISRLYYTVIFHSGQRLVIYKDLNNGQWYQQKY
jgi:hypothetical protein